jgi:hypothetical protein
MPKKFQGIVVAVACLLCWTTAGAAALDHVRRPVEGNTGFLEQIVVRPCNNKFGCGPTTRPADTGLFENVAAEEKPSVRPCNKPFGCNAATIRPDNVGLFVKGQPFGQWMGTERELLAGTKQVPPTTITPEAAKAHIDKLEPALQNQGFTVERFPGSAVPMVRITAPKAF